MKILMCIVLSAVAIPLFAQPYAGDTWKDASKKGTGSVSFAYVETPSFVYVDESGKLTGICVDIMNDFVAWLKDVKKVDVKPNFVGNGTSFRGMYDKVKISKGGVFGLGNITITEERKKEVKFSQPFITNFAILITQDKIPTLTKFEDLPKTFADLTAYTAKGTLNEKRMMELKSNYFPNMKVAYTTTSQETLEKLFIDPKGFAYLDLAFYLEAVQKKKNIKRHPIADKAAEQFGFIMPLGTDWAPVLDEFLKNNGGYTASARYKSILVKHMGEAGMKLMQSSK
ncbi:substrate-binding periplasmic protein [Ohtaekwangia kribbensis]|jgi:ABC-type amino acid transport substrate-binding protein|uniref:Substrate-binding periplasmic protein n=1 Tax=Ohtaekwangia kribbensis TaxID=688913 RepID=A0ABW3KEM0_9BACT